MKLIRLLESHVHIEIDTDAAIAASIERNVGKFKNIKGLSYGPGEIVESVTLDCDHEEAQKRASELDRRISDTINNYIIELRSTTSKQ